MLAIIPVPATPDPLQEQARTLFRLYAQFLLDTHSCGTHVPKLEQEILTLPAAYAEHGGEVLLAIPEDEPELQPAGCISYRTAPGDSFGQSCEIKRLFVLPAFRGRHIAEKLVLATLERGAARNFTRAILDTDAATMPAALALYLRLGFHEYKPAAANLTFLHKHIS